MAHVDQPSQGGPRNTPPRDSYPAPSTTNTINQEESEDSEEWEYEYSTTETETYYVTLDLTTPNVEPRRRVRRNLEQGVPAAKWRNHGIAPQRRDRLPSPKSYRYTAGADKSGMETPAGEADNSQKPVEEGDSPQGSPKMDASWGNDGNEVNGENGENEDHEGDEGEKPVEEDPTPTQVQILDFHSENPIVSYGGHVFSCQWASNVGTELLFTAHDDENPLPVLRSLPGDVDLLAASSCRLIPKSVTLETKHSARSRIATALPARSDARGKDPTISIPVGFHASQKRKDQARFLEKLMSIKREKGEDDKVTIIAQKRNLNNKWKAIWQKKRQTERARLTKIVKKGADTPSGIEEVEKAKERLEEMDNEDEMRKLREPAAGPTLVKKAGRKKKGAPDTPEGTKTRAKRGPRVPKKQGLQGLLGQDGSSGAIEDTPTPGLSTPTPRRSRYAEADEEMYDDEMEEGEFNGGQEMEDMEGDEDLYDDGQDDALMADE